MRERASEEKSESKRWEGQVARFERYENEFIALRMELFGIAWVMRFGFGVSRILDHELGVRSALENNDRLEIWEVTDAYNRAVGEYVSTVVDDVHHKQKNCYSLRGVIPSTAHELEQKRHSIHQELLSFLTKSDNDPEFYQRCTESCEHAARRIGLAKNWPEVAEGLPWHLSNTFYKALNVNIAPEEYRIMCKLVQQMYSDIFNDLSRVRMLFNE